MILSGKVYQHTGQSHKTKIEKRNCQPNQGLPITFSADITDQFVDKIMYQFSSVTTKYYHSVQEITAIKNSQVSDPLFNVD